MPHPSLTTQEHPVIAEATWADVNSTYGCNPGIYRVKLKNASLTGYEPIQRILGVDDGGLLYIGMSSAINARFGGLRTGIYGAYSFRAESGHIYTNPKPHPVGQKMAKGFTKKVAIERIFIEVEAWPLATERDEAFDPWAYEAQAIGTYCDRYGEPPPFNDSWGGGVQVLPVDT